MVNLPGTLERVFWYASLAPSPHNCQPWQVKMLVGEDYEFMIQSDSSRWLPQCDPGNREVMLSIGTFWENLEQAAAAFGFETRAEITASRPTDIDILKVKLVRNSHKPDNSPGILTAIEKRYTNRKRYKRKPLLNSHLEECQAILAGSGVYFPRESEQGQWIALNQVHAMRQQVFHDGKQEELAAWARFSRTSALERGDGTTAEMSGCSPLAQFFWYNFMTPASLLSKRMRNMTVEWVKRRVNRCAGFFVVTSENSSVPPLLEAGKVLERISLKCTQLNIQCSPMAQLVNESPWNRQAGEKLGVEKPMQMVISVGYSNKQHRPERHLRRPVKDFVIQDA